MTNEIKLRDLYIRGLYTTDHIYKHILFTKNFYELKLLNEISKMGLSGTYIDIGANIGNHSLFFSKYCNSKNVYSFEIDENIFNVLKTNIIKNNLNIKAFNIGIGECEKFVNISHIDPNNTGITKIIDEVGDIKVIPLDNMDINDVTLIKIDVEGYELNVLKGCVKTIEKYKPVLVVELQTIELFNEFNDLVKEYGYFSDVVNYSSTPTYIFKI